MLCHYNSWAFKFTWKTKRKEFPMISLTEDTAFDWSSWLKVGYLRDRGGSPGQTQPRCLLPKDCSKCPLANTARPRWRIEIWACTAHQSLMNCKRIHQDRVFQYSNSILIERRVLLHRYFGLHNCLASTYTAGFGVILYFSRISPISGFTSLTLSPGW